VASSAFNFTGPLGRFEFTAVFVIAQIRPVSKTASRFSAVGELWVLVILLDLQ
jgi:hypothetical protein